MVGNRSLPRRNIEIPLLDLSDSELQDELVVPLPSSELSEEVRAQHVYGMVLRRPIHKMMVQEAIDSGNNLEIGDMGGKERAYGCIISKSDDSLVGAVGCSANIVMRASIPNEPDNSDVGENALIAVVYKGSYRFVVTKVIKTIPYPVGIVDELLDNEPENDDEAPTLVRRIMIGLKDFIDLKLSEPEKNLSPLEQSILVENGVTLFDPATERSNAEEMEHVFDAFQESLIDIPLAIDRNYAVGMMAAELIKVENAMRRKIITMTDGVERLRLLCDHIENVVERNQNVANVVVEKQSEKVDVNLKVGQPQLPPWANQITIGTRLEYYWNEELGWCSGIVSDHPLRIVDEIILLITFDSDGETHRLPLNADEKLRWRPQQLGSFE